MAEKAKYRCPVCKKPLTKKEYDRALRIHEARAKHLEALERNLKKRERRLEQEKKAAKKEGQELEQKRTRRLLAGREKEIQKLKDRIRQLRQRTTPQSEGLEFEEILVKRLRSEFQRFGDDIQRKGKRGDVLHFVMDAGKQAGVIIYECKRTPRISGSHVRQAAQAKQSRHADFAVLVTTGTRRGFGGLAEMSGVLVVAPTAVIALVMLLRKYLIEMLRAGIEKSRRARMANQLLKFIKSPEFKNPIEEVTSLAAELKESVREEYDWHMRDWEKRLRAYDRIEWDGSIVQDNVQRVLRGEKPKHMLPPKPKLLLPGPAVAIQR